MNPPNELTSWPMNTSRKSRCRRSGEMSSNIYGVAPRRGHALAGKRSQSASGFCRRSSAEQLRRELGQVFTPVDPGVTAGRLLVDDVEAVLLQHRDRGRRRLQQEIVFAGREPDELEVARTGRGVELRAVSVLPIGVV